MSRTAMPLLALGVFVGAAGVHPKFNNGDMVVVGILMTAAAMPAVFAQLLRRSQQATDEQLATAHTQGYQLALGHVARGLLDQPTAPHPTSYPTSTTADRAGLGALPSNVRRLHPTQQENQERTAL
ncbi:hypothetical protein [Streptomyces sp. ERV7]|uniref:hypothetical protein n=1 Tax=Streptomyces sp. ERV7 TaxID=1322334 RepID=UPI00131CA892|nr:hypothetical protein [Streptomyces sp. ERV7]